MLNFKMVFCVMVFFNVVQAWADTAVKGFALDRFYSSAPGGGWLVMDSLDMHGGLGAAVELTYDYARDPLKIQGLAVVSQQVSEDVGLALTYDRYRLYLNLPSPIRATGDSGTVGDYSYTAPNINWGLQPDTLSDFRIGIDTRFLGAPRDAFRMGAGVQFYIPNGTDSGGIRSDYDSDVTYRFMGRVLAAGDIGRFTYAGQLGIHFRSLNDGPAPGSPQGNELLMGLAGGMKLPVFESTQALVLGMEFYGASALQALMGQNTTALEGLLSCRLEGLKEDARQVRFKVGVGSGIDPSFGAPDLRVVVAVEIFDYNFFSAAQKLQQ